MMTGTTHQNQKNKNKNERSCMLKVSQRFHYANVQQENFSVRVYPSRNQIGPATISNERLQMRGGKKTKISQKSLV